jgi:hypothetical protein
VVVRKPGRYGQFGLAGSGGARHCQTDGLEASTMKNASPQSPVKPIAMVIKDNTAVAGDGW